MNWFQHLLWLYWDAQARHLKGRLLELEIEAGHLEETRCLTEQRPQKAEARRVQWGGIV